MNILLAFKAEPDLSMLAEIDWQAAACGSQEPDPSLMRVVMGNDEQGAAELMLQARDRDPGLHLSVITLGDARATTALRQLASLGFERRTRVNCMADIRFAPEFVAGQIANHVRQHNIDMVVLGTQSSEGQNGQTGWLLAEILGWPCLAQVTDLIPQGTVLQVQCENMERRHLWQLQHPAVLMVQNRGQMALRVPGMRARLAAATADIDQIEGDKLTEPPLLCQTLARQIYRRAGIIIDGNTTQEKVLWLWQKYLAERMT